MTTEHSNGNAKAVEDLIASQRAEERKEVEAASKTVVNDEVMRQLLDDKHGQPSKYASFWEFDDEDIEHWTDEEIRSDPKKLILKAAENGKSSLIAKMVKEHSDLVDARDNDGYTPLHRAAYGGHCKAADLLISLGADVMARTKDGWTPLHSAAHWDQREMCELLLNLGAEPNAITEGGNTPLHVAAVQCATPKTISFLLKWPHIRTDLRNAQGDTPKDICERHAAFAEELFGK